jgi:hypothetical protein
MSAPVTSCFGTENYISYTISYTRHDIEDAPKRRSWYTRYCIDIEGKSPMSSTIFNFEAFCTFDIDTISNLRPLPHATDVRKVMLPRGIDPLMASPDGEQRGGWGGPSHLRCSSRLAAQLKSRTGCAGGWFDGASRGLTAAGHASSSRFAPK